MSREFRGARKWPGARQTFRPLTPNPRYMARGEMQCGGGDNQCTPDTANCSMFIDTDGDGCIREVGDENTSCGQRSDAMVCTQSSDVTCVGEIYRGCFYGQTDTDPDTDYCCAGHPDGLSNDNIDHATCGSGYDAGWGSSCYWWDDPGGSSL